MIKVQYRRVEWLKKPGYSASCAKLFRTPILKLTFQVVFFDSGVFIPEKIFAIQFLAIRRFSKIPNKNALALHPTAQSVHTLHPTAQYIHTRPLQINIEFMFLDFYINSLTNFFDPMLWKWIQMELKHLNMQRWLHLFRVLCNVYRMEEEEKKHLRKSRDTLTLLFIKKTQKHKQEQIQQFTL